MDIDAQISSRIAAIEAIVTPTIRRDISRLVSFAKGNIERAARSIADTETPHIALVAGFFIRYAEPPSPETDGLNGTAHMATAFAEAGFEVTVITDAPCAKAMWAILTEVPHQVRLEVVGVDRRQVLELRERLERLPHPPTHLIATERASPGTDGKPHREHGWDMSAETAPLDLLFQDAEWKPSWTTIGIGDGGNEIGMGCLPADVVARDIPNGELIAAQTATDFLIVSSVSNWGAYALIAALALMRQDLRSALLKHLTPEMEKVFLTTLVELGQAIDDGRADRPGTIKMSVDRLPVEDHMALIDQIRTQII